VSSYLRIDGEETALTGARLTWEDAPSEGRRGVLFHLAAHGGRRMLHLAAWAPGHHVDALSGQTVSLRAVGPDAALDGRLFVQGQVRFGRVTHARAVLSLDGVVEGLDPTVATRAVVEADVRCPVRPVARRRFCLSCGGSLDAWAVEHDAFVGGHRVRLHTVPALCGACQGYVGPPRHCPECAVRYGAHQIHTLVDEGTVDWWATCLAGHTHAGTLSAEPT